MSFLFSHFLASFPLFFIFSESLFSPLAGDPVAKAAGQRKEFHFASLRDFARAALKTRCHSEPFAVTLSPPLST